MPAKGTSSMRTRVWKAIEARIAILAAASAPLDVLGRVGLGVAQLLRLAQRVGVGVARGPSRSG